MNWMFFEYGVLAIIFNTLYLLGIKQSKKRKFLTVKNLRYRCNTDHERNLYDQLLKSGIYVSPNIRLGYLSIPLALEQYKIAILIYPKTSSAFVRYLGLKHKELYLRSTGWNVMKLSEDAILTNLQTAIKAIISHEKIKKI
ncbi:hypothetical protein DS745_19235 [Anaerobacillus alkaliphilus]|uniref:DUF559 domain-containing protein n=1 Tax=Anaerobacillus alkaliphilus TaxID=1548597 RepID=A0A4Q0VQQ9_9BACI|nr:hypothetical protein [Anaerobacillus alkaliphilus]RXI98461.1 hypothetical protein DS745_19235 [Anaerobacillus alkaliphilus]